MLLFRDLVLTEPVPFARLNTSDLLEAASSSSVTCRPLTTEQFFHFVSSFLTFNLSYLDKHSWNPLALIYVRAWHLRILFHLDCSLIARVQIFRHQTFEQITFKDLSVSG
ncbi:hypothetical protein CEXT_34441 [Caerostris extrusa]|uniref:Uncharacterized protein n=1 Tax=Caerostris extrusa TaxID=172846 RepID=A0AAV4WM72_CAEEX|nr:hypothetical protein CEXT_34441 [Caerostris extrusa]